MAKVTELPGALTDAELYRLEQAVQDRIGAAQVLSEPTELLTRVKRVIQEVKQRRDAERQAPEATT